MRPSESAMFHQIDGWLTLEEADALYEAAAQVPEAGRIVEIGSFKGRSTYALALGAQFDAIAKMVYAVDPFTGNPGEDSFFPTRYKADFLRNLDQFIKEGIVTPLTMSSAGATMLGIRPSLVFVDGSHIFADVLFDMTAWWEKLLPGGRMAVHDSQGTHPPVANALKTFLERNNLHVESVTGSISWLRKGE